MGRASKAKGSSFERLVAKMVLTAAGNEFGTKDCYRTPMSGGHHAARQNGEGDLVVSLKLRKRFPWCVECKHSKGFRAEHLFSPTGQFLSWLQQAKDEAEADCFGRLPLLVFRGYAGSIFAAVQKEDLGLVGTAVYKGLPGTKAFMCEGWVVRPLADLLVGLKKQRRKA